MNEIFAFSGVVRRWTNDNGASWFFLTVEGATAASVTANALMTRLEEGRSRGFGSVKVAATIGASRWRTSLFPQGDETWLLPLKARIRQVEEIEEGDRIEATLELWPEDT